MRVTQKTKEKTRNAILETARGLFASNGFDETTTRDIAAGAGIAAGTLFNYFPSKEALGLALVAEAAEGAEGEYEATRREEEGLEERLFAYVAIQLRHDRIHATDCADCEATEGRIDRIDRVLELDGDLDAVQRARLREIADRCPVHRTLMSEKQIQTRLA